MAKYLVTGGCGFIGSHLTHFLVRAGHDVIVVDNLDTGKKERLPEQATFYEVSINDTAVIPKLFEDIDGNVWVGSAFFQ